MKMGTATEVPGLYKIPGGFVLRAKATIGSVTVEKRRKLLGSSRAEAAIALEKLRDEARAEAERKEAGVKDGTLSAFALRWTEELGGHVATERLSHGTVETHLGNLERFVLPFFGERLAVELRPRDFQAWFRWLEEQRTSPVRKGRGRSYRVEPKPYAKDTLKSAWSTLRLFVRWVTIEADLPANPAADVRFDIRHRGPEPKATLTEAEASALLAAVVDRKVRAMLILQFVGGMRFSEVSGLHWSDVGPGSLTISRSVRKGVVGPPKTEASRRVVALDKAATDALEELRPHSVGEVVFPGSTGNYLTISVYNDALAEAAACAGVAKHVTSHVIRRTANNLLRRKAGSLVAKAILGHVTDEMHAHYSDVDRDERAAAIGAAFGPVFGGTGTTPEA